VILLLVVAGTADPATILHPGTWQSWIRTYDYFFGLVRDAGVAWLNIEHTIPQ